MIGNSVGGTGDISIDTWNLSSKAHNVQLFGRDITLGGITLGSGDVTMYAKGTNGITVTADSLSSSSGNLSLLSAGSITVNESLENSGAGQIRLFAGWDGSSAITTPALFNIQDINLGVTTRNITIGANGNLSSAGTGTSVLLVAKGAFLNNAAAAANAISTPGGRYLVYSNNPTDTTKNGLVAKSLYNKTYAANAPSSIAGASRFIYNFQPTATITADSISAPNIGSAIYSYSVTGLVNGDLAVDALSGTPLYTLGTPTGNTYPIQLTAGTMTSPEGYALTYNNGILTAPNSSNLNGSVLTYTSNNIEISKAEETSQSPGEISKDSDDIDTDVNCLVSDASGCLVH